MARRLGVDQSAQVSIRKQSKVTIRSEKARKKLKIWLPHVCLVLMVFIYIMAGAVVFYSIENPHEKKVRERIKQEFESKKNDFLDFVRNINRSLGQQEFTRLVDLELHKLEEYLFEHGFSNEYTARIFDKDYDIAEEKYIWNFLSSILFCITTLTTIGYGRPTPQTTHGRIVCVLYGLVGIPLVIITIANFAKFLGAFFLDMYKHVRRRAEQLPIWLAFFIMLAFIVVFAVTFASFETWTIPNSLYFAVISIYTIGFGDMYPNNESYYLLVFIFLILSGIVTTMCVDLIASQYLVKMHYFGRKVASAKERAMDAMNNMRSMIGFLPGAHGALQFMALHAFTSEETQLLGLNVEGPAPFRPEEEGHLLFIDRSPMPNRQYSFNRSYHRASSEYLGSDIHTPESDQEPAFSKNSYFLHPGKFFRK